MGKFHKLNNSEYKASSESFFIYKSCASCNDVSSNPSYYTLHIASCKILYALFSAFCVNEASRISVLIRGKLRRPNLRDSQCYDASESTRLCLKHNFIGSVVLSADIVTDHKTKVSLMQPLYWRHIYHDHMFRPVNMLRNATTTQKAIWHMHYKLPRQSTAIKFG
jgi:hypothetical protein